MDIDVPELIDAAVVRLRQEEGLADAGVVDGPELTGADHDDWVLVGFDGDQEGEFLAATSEEDWAGQLGTSREKTIQLTLGLLSRRGDGDVKAARDRVYAMRRVIGDVLAADPTLGLPGAVQCAIRASSLRQPQTDAGVQARLALTLVCRTT